MDLILTDNIALSSNVKMGKNGSLFFVDIFYRRRFILTVRGESMEQLIWKDRKKLPDFPAAEGEYKTDVLIIGGGICGILCAYFLSWAGVDYMLAEAGKIGQGISGLSSGMITVQHGLIYDKMLKELGREKAQLYYRANQQALERYISLCRNLDCGFEQKTGYVYSRTDRSAIEKEVRAVRILGGTAEFSERHSLPFGIAGAVKTLGQVQLDPERLIGCLAPGLNIYEHTRIEKIEKGQAFFKKGKITAEKVIAAVHAPEFTGWAGRMKLYRRQVDSVVLDSCAPMDGIYCDAARAGLAMRNCGSGILVSGNGRGGKTQFLSAVSECWPQAKVLQYWSGQEYMSFDGIPCVGPCRGRHGKLYVAYGWNRWGMTNAMAAAMLLRDLVLERENEYADLYLPQRSIGKRQLVVHGWSALSHWFLPGSKNHFQKKH